MLFRSPYETVAPLIDKVRAQSLPQVPEEDRNDNRDKLQQDLINAVSNPETVTPETV